MIKLTNFDVLIVYAEGLARSACPSAKSIAPFSKRSKNYSYNIVYGYFLEICAKFNLKAAFATSADIIGPGFCKCFWTYQDNVWTKVNSTCFSPLIFDKFSPINSGIKSRRQLLFSSDKIKPFNDPDLYNLFFDKQKTYEKLSHYAIPTISVGDKTLKSIKKACKELNKLLSEHPDAKDFSPDIIMKDRFGAGGRHVHKFKEGDSAKMLSTIQKNFQISYIIQPYSTSVNPVDIRLIYLKGEIVQSYIRTAKAGEFRCNEHQGGLLTYVPLCEIPDSVVTKSNLIANELNKKCSLFTLDFIVSNNGNAYFLEGNTGPGLDWNMDLKENEIEAKKLIRMVVGEIATRALN